MKILKPLILFSLIASMIVTSSCDKNGDLLVFSIENDIELGEKIATQIAENESIDILSPERYPVSYAYIESMLENILNSEEITNKEEFNWKVNIINNDQVLNAFATPGGQIYVYTGLVYFFNEEDALAGVIAHQVAQTDRRHASRLLQRKYGISLLIGVVEGGESSSLEQITSNIVGSQDGLVFSRDNEAEADEFSVRYLASTQYACNGAALFFEKLLSNEEQRNPEFLIAHPSPDGRVENINVVASNLSCSTTIDDNSRVRYLGFRNSLP